MQTTNGRVVLPTQQLPAVQPVWNYVAWFVIVFSVCLILFVVLPTLREVTATIKAAQESIDRREAERTKESDRRIVEEIERERTLKESRKYVIEQQADILLKQKQARDTLSETVKLAEELRHKLKGN